MNFTDLFVRNIYDFSQQKFDSKTIKEAKICILDYLACTYLGAYTQKERIYDYFDVLGGDNGQSLVVGFKKKLSKPTAAFINGLNAHLLEYDDGQRFGAPHLAAVNISALLAVYDNHNMTGTDFIRGIIVSYEATIKLSMLLQPGHKKRGFHSSCTAGTIGCALGIASALKYDFDGFKKAASTAATAAFGVLEALDDDSELKPYNIAHTALEGVMAALTAHIGLNVPNDILGGNRGYFNAIGYELVEPDAKLFLENNINMINTIYRKPYASCRHCHPAVEAIFNIKVSNNIDIHDVDKIIVETYGLALNGHDHKKISSISSAKMSIPYSVGVMLYTNHCSYDSFTNELINNKELQKIINKIEVIEDINFSKLVPQNRAARVTVFTKCKTYSCTVSNPKGEPENPISLEDIVNKFVEFANIYGLKREVINDIVEGIDNLEERFDYFYKLLEGNLLY